MFESASQTPTAQPAAVYFDRIYRGSYPHELQADPVTRKPVYVNPSTGETSNEAPEPLPTGWTVQKDPTTGQARKDPATGKPKSFSDKSNTSSTSGRSP